MRLTRHEVRLAARSFTRHRGFTTVAVLSLALAISLNTTMYSVIDAMVNPKIDMRAPDRLYQLRIWGDEHHKVDDATRNSMLRMAAQFLEGAASYRASFSLSVGVEHGQRYTQTAPTVVSPNLFQLLGVHPLAGRVFTDSDFVSGAEPVIISDALAGTLFAGGESPIGATIDIDAVKHPVIGVLGADARFPGSHDNLWLLPKPGTQLDALPLNIVRLRDGVSVQEAAKGFEVLSIRLADLAGESPKDTRYQLGSATTPQFHYVSFHFALIGAVVAVLLIACANLGNLQLARGIGRSRELALRAALGASRRDIVKQLLLESALLAGAGLAVGLVLTFWGVHVLKSRIPPAVAEYVIAPQTSWRVLLFAIVASVICTILVGLIPAIRVSRVDPNVLLKSGAGTGANKKNRRQYGFMVVAEIGLSIALLSGAAIVVRTAMHVRQAKVNYDYTRLADTRLYVRASKDSVIRYATLANEVLPVVRALPEVAEATLFRDRDVANRAITVVDPSGSSVEIPAPMASYKIVTPSYFRTYGLPIAKGRDFLDGVPAAPEVIVDQATARALWPNSDPIGALIKLGDFKSTVPWVRVVGVVGVVEQIYDLSPEQFRTRPTNKIGAIYYLPDGRDSARVSQGFSYNVITRAKGKDPERVPIVMLRTMRQISPRSYVWSRSMNESLGLLYERQRHDFVASTFVIFAAMAIGLAALGIYGIVAHTIAERTRELGVRIALGATARNVVGVVLREGNPTALGGVALGLYLTKSTVSWLHAFSVDGDEYDVVLFASMAAVLFAVAVLAALIPALRATRIDPVESLRSE